MNKTLLQEAIVVGVCIVIIGSIVSYSIKLLSPNKLPDVCKDWNKFYIMEICLFLTGFIAHFIFEYVGANKWYCKNGNACKK